MPKLLERLVAPLVDATTLLAAWLALPALAAQLGSASQLNLAILLGAHFLMCLGVAAANYLPLTPQPARRSAAGVDRADAQQAPAGQVWLLVLSLPFSIGLIAMLIISGRLLDETTVGGTLLSEAGGNGQVGLVLLVTLAFIVLVGAFPTAVLYQPKARLAPGSSAYWLVRVGSLLAVNAMVLVTAAFWQGYLADAEPLQAGLGLRIFLTLILYPVFLLFYAAPRLALLSLEPGRGQLAGFLIMLALFVWQLTA